MASVAALVAIGPLGEGVPKGFLPENDEAQFEVNVRAPEGTSLEATDADRRARRARDPRAAGEVASTLVTVGDGDQRTPNVAQDLRAADRSDRARRCAGRS